MRFYTHRVFYAVPVQRWWSLLFEDIDKAIVVWP